MSNIEDNLKFLKEMIFLQKGESKAVKDSLATASREYEGLFPQAQEFINNSNDQGKIN